MIRAVFFDLDDTLWDFAKTMKHAYSNFSVFLAEKNLPHAAAILGDATLVRARLEKIVAKHSTNSFGAPFIDYNLVRRDLHRSVFKEVGVNIAHHDEELINEQWLNFRASSAQFFPGAIELLKWLKQQGLILGAVTNGNADLNKIPHLPQDLFSFQTSPGSAGLSKPHPRMYLHAAECAGISDMSEILFVGDNFENDVKGPKQVGMRTVFVDWEKSTLHADANGFHEHADWVVHDILEVEEIIKSCNQIS